MTIEDAKLLEDALQSAKSAHKRLDRVEAEQKDQRELIETVAVLSNNMANMQRDLGEMKEDVKALAAVPAKRWDAVIGYVMAALASGIVGVIIGVVFK